MSLWGHLEQRFGTEQPRKLLALDGGGIRGVLSLEILAEIERQIEAKTGIARLGDYFDYIGGTSTGAIIATGLSIGMSAADLLTFYRESGVAMFEKNALLKRLKSFYKTSPWRSACRKSSAKKMAGMQISPPRDCAASSWS